MLHIAEILDTLSPEDRRVVAYEIHRTYGGRLTAERYGVTFQSARRAALMKDAELRALIQRRDLDRCRYCGVGVNWNDRRSPTGATYDHVDPNGDNSPENLVVACHHCNVVKNQRTPEQAGMVLLPVPNSELDRESDTGSQDRVLSTLNAASAVGSSALEVPKGSKKQPRVLAQDDLDKAKGLLKSADFEFLQACPEPFRTEWLGWPDWWVSIRDGYPKVDLQEQASKNMAHVQGKFSPAQIAHLNLRERLRRWVAKADMWRQNAEERKAVRR